MTASSETDQLPSIDEVIARFRARRAEVEAAEARARELRERYDGDVAVFLGKIG